MKLAGIIVYSTIVLTGMLTSCLKEKECPPQGNVFVVMKDKNYDNVREIAQVVPVDENLAFRHYLGSLNVQYLPVGSAEELSGGQSVALQGEDRILRLETGSLASGAYEITALGNIANGSLPAVVAKAGTALLELHPSSTESADLYIDRDTVNLPLQADRTLLLRRVKGKLLLLHESLPAEVARLDVQVSGISKNVDGNMVYSGSTSIAKSFPLAGKNPAVPLELLLAPNDQSGNTMAAIALFDAAGTPLQIFSNIMLKIDRNRISALEVKYDPSSNQWEIWMILEGQWVQLHHLDIE